MSREIHPTAIIEPGAVIGEGVYIGPYAYIGGEVNNPGIYPLDAEYNIEDVVRMAGGVTGNADIDALKRLIAGRIGGDLTLEAQISLRR